MKAKILSISESGKTEKYIKDPAFYERFEIQYVPVSAPISEWIRLGQDAEYIITDAIAKLPAELIQALPKLKLIHSNGVAYNGIDLKAADACGVTVCNCRSMNATSVAEQALLLMLGLLRGVVSGDKALREGRQMEVKMGYMQRSDLKEIADCQIGFLGFGAIGQATARLVNVMGAKVCYYARHRVPEDIENQFNAQYLPLDELLASSDILSLHVPVTKETTHMVQKDFLAKMKPGAYLINTARGELVDVPALLDALRCGHLAGAGLDTLENEPVQSDNPMLLAESDVESRILYSCHVGGISASSFRRGYQMIYEDLMRVESGEPPLYRV